MTKALNQKSCVEESPAPTRKSAAPRAKDDAFPMLEVYGKESVNGGIYNETMRRVASCGFCCARVGERGRGRASVVDHRRAR